MTKLQTILAVTLTTVVSVDAFRNMHLNTHHVHSGPRSRIHSLMTNGSSIPVRHYIFFFGNFVVLVCPSPSPHHSHRTPVLTILIHYSCLFFFHRLVVLSGPLPSTGRLSKLARRPKIFPSALIPVPVIWTFQPRDVLDARPRHRTISTIHLRVQLRRKVSFRSPTHTRRVI